MHKYGVWKFLKTNPHFNKKISSKRQFSFLLILFKSPVVLYIFNLGGKRPNAPQLFGMKLIPKKYKQSLLIFSPSDGTAEFMMTEFAPSV